MWFDFLRRPACDVTCHYCGSELQLLPPHFKGKGKAQGVAVGTESNYWCSACECTTLRSSTGEVLEDPAQRAEVHSESLARRAFPIRSRLPAAYNSSSPFCRSCLANQSLQIHLLAAYPSDEDDHTEPPLLSDYRKSLDTRYPIVCPSCAPAVEQDIAEKDARARSAALGWRLRESQKGLRMRELKESERRNSWQWWWLGMVWRARGVAFWCTHVSGILGCAAAVASPTHFTPPPDSAAISNGWMPIVALLSILWVAWDPTWSRARTERSLGRPPEVVGRSIFIIIQMSLYLLRLALSLVHYLQLLEDRQLVRRVAATSLAVFLSSLVASLYTIRLRRPVSIRLSTSRPRIAPSPPQDPADPLAGLSLSPISAPSPLRQRAKKAPTFGEAPSWSTLSAGHDVPDFPSIATPSMDIDSEDEANENSMDWDPLPPLSGPPAPPPRQESSWTLAPPRFFAPQEPTGLETMFQRTLQLGRDGAVSGDRKRWWKWW